MRGADLYRLLLWCYPAPFRREYGQEMLGAFHAELCDARRAGRGLAIWASAAIWARALRDLVPTAFREHRHVLMQDLRHAVRVLRARPGFTLVAIASLALGIGANTAIFSLLNSVLYQALPVRDPHQLVLLTDPQRGGVSRGMQAGERSLLTYEEFRALQAAGGGTITSLMAASSSLHRTEARLAGGEPEDLAVRLVSASYFDSLGVAPIVGRAFDGDREPAPGAAPFAVLSHELWQRRFGGRPDAVGRTIALRDGVVQVIGVAPPWFFGERVGERPDAWIPLAMQAAVLPGRDWLRDDPRGLEKVMWLQVFGRLRPGVALERAQAEANLIFQQGLGRYYGGIADTARRQRFLDQRLRLTPAATGASSLRAFVDPLVILLGGAAVVLVIACANLGSLLLARATGRAREVAVRLALGAGRGRLVRQLLTENLCLALAGGAAGLAVAVVLRHALVRLVSDRIVLPPALDLRVLGFAFGSTVAAGLLLGLLPVLRLTKIPAGAGLREPGRGIAGSATWVRVGRFVVIAQLACSVPLLVGAGLLAGTLVNLQRVDLGYDPHRLVSVRVDASSAGYDAAREAAAFDAILTRIRALPGVRAASYANNGLFGGIDNGNDVAVEGYVPKGNGDGESDYDAVGPGYFSALGIPIVAGRQISDTDVAGGARVCVINEAFARRFFAGRNPVGFHLTTAYADERRSYRIVGVARDSRQQRLREAIEHRFYAPATRPASEINTVTFLVRASADSGRVLGDVRRLIREVEPRMALGTSGHVADSIDRRLAQDRMVAQISIVFAALAACLAALGLYGVLSYGVARRTAEIGLRKALGAGHGAVMALVVRETGWLLAAGLAVGGALAAGAAQLIASRLYGLSPADPVTFGIAIAALGIVAIVATWLPAYRASRVDPLVALRQE